MINTAQPDVSKFTGDSIPVVKMGEEVTPVVTTPEVTPPVEGQQPATEPPVTPPASTTPEPPAAPQFQDSDAFTFLSEKLGRTIASYDDLKPVEAPELNPHVKQIDDWAKRTGRPIEDWVKFQKNPADMQDLEVVRENLRLEYPTLTEAEIQQEMELTYLPSDDDLDTDKARKTLQLKKDATKGRQTLESLRLEFDKTSPTIYPKEVQEDLALAKEIKEKYQESAQNRQHYVNGLKTASSALEKITMTLGDTTVDYTIPVEDRASLAEYADTMPHWKNADGTTNYQALIRDAAIIRNFDKLLKAAYEQGQGAGTDQVVAAANNVTLGSPSATNAPTPTQKFKVEGFDQMMKGNVVKIRS